MEALAGHRKALGLAMFEPYIRTLLGDEFDDLGGPGLIESIHAHPEWWEGEPSESGLAASLNARLGADGRLRMMFLMSRDRRGRAHVTTVGMSFRGLPELQMKEVAANHCRAARFLMTAVARRLLAHAASLGPGDEPLPDRLSGLEIDVAPEHAEPSPVLFTRSAIGSAPVRVRLDLEEFAGRRSLLGRAVRMIFRRPSALLLTVRAPAGGMKHADSWLTDTCRRLGLDAPSAMPDSAFEEAMSEASRRAVRDLARVRERIAAGSPDDQFVMIKTGLPTRSGGREFVWVKVDGVVGEEFVGTLEVEPRDLPGYEKGQAMRVRDADVFDHLVLDREQGLIQPALTDVVAQDFGRDLPG